MPRRQTAVPVLNLVQVLDQEVAPSGSIAEQGQDILQRLGIDLPAFRAFERLYAALAPFLFFRGRFRRIDEGTKITHGIRSFIDLRGRIGLVRLPYMLSCLDESARSVQLCMLNFLAFRASVPASPNWKCRRIRWDNYWERLRRRFRPLVSLSPWTGCIPRLLPT